jgi:hypothetical protein
MNILFFLLSFSLPIYQNHSKDFNDYSNQNIGSACNLSLLRDTSNIEEKLVGWWYFKVKDSIDFSLKIICKNDSIYCYYSIVFEDGKYLNSADYDNDYALQVPKNIFLNSSKPLQIRKYWDGSIVNVRLYYDANLNLLIWKLDQNNNDNASWLFPKYAELHRSP